jgi:hypothetical protein
MMTFISLCCLPTLEMFINFNNVKKCVSGPFDKRKWLDIIFPGVRNYETDINRRKTWERDFPDDMMRLTDRSSQSSLMFGSEMAEEEGESTQSVEEEKQEESMFER